MTEPLPPSPPPSEAPPAPPAGPDEGGRRHLTRSSAHRVLGGVCGGVAERFDMDPVVVRVVFAVVALLWGLGILIYLAMWVIVPSDGLAPPAEPAASGRLGWWLRVALPLAVVIAAAIVALALVGRSGLGVARGLGAFWLVCMVLLAVVALLTPARRLTLRRLVALAFLGFVSVVVLAVTAFLVALAVIGVPVEGGSGVHTFTPASAAQIEPVYRGAYGETRIDLTEVAFGPGTYHLRASQAVGQLIVDVPTDVRVLVTSHVGIGQSGSGAYLPHAVYPAAGRHAGTLVLDLSVGIGRIEVDQIPAGSVVTH